MRRQLLCAMTALLAGGCSSSYVTPGGAAKLSTMRDTDAGLRDSYAAKPLAEFPAMLAVARLQGSGYQSRTARGFGQGSYSVITTRDVETDADFDRLSALPGVRGVAPVSRMLLPERLTDEKDVRLAAARVKSDVLLLYTFDTQFYVKDFAGPVTVFTLGLSPNRRAYVTTTASAVLLDTRTGYVYGGAEASAKSDQLANGWTSDDAVDDTRLRTEKESFGRLIGDLEKSWPGIVRQYGKPTTRTAGN